MNSLTVTNTGEDSLEMKSRFFISFCKVRMKGKTNKLAIYIYRIYNFLWRTILENISLFLISKKKLFLKTNEN